MAWPLQAGTLRRRSGPMDQRNFRVTMSMVELMATEDDPAKALGPKASRASEIRDFARSELFERTFQEGMELVEETAAYLDGDGRRDSRLLSRSAALAYAGESMKLTTRLMQVASWLLVQRAVREGDMSPEAACEPRYRLSERAVEAEPGHPEIPIALVEHLVRAEKLYDRVVYLDRRMYLDDAPELDANPVLSQMDRLEAAFRE
jgi:regulator of CtrA degradation